MTTPKTSHQPTFADAAHAGDGFARGNLDGDVQIPRDPIRDPVVMDWEALTEPRLSPAHDAVGQALASYFTRDGGRVYLTQQMIADRARLSRPIICKLLQDLEAVGRFQRQEISTHQGHRGDVYVLAGENTDWAPLNLGLAGRTTAAEFVKDQRIHQLEGALRLLAQRMTGEHDLPDSVLALLETLSDSPESAEISERYRGLELTANKGSTPLLSSAVNSALPDPPRKPASDSQMNLILLHQERTALTDEDILASWPDIDRYGPVPDGLDPSLLTTLQANRIVQWVKRQVDAPVQPPAADPRDARAEMACTCQGDGDSVAAPDPGAAKAWSATLEKLELELPSATFESWLKQTEGIGFNGTDLLVEVPNVFTITWLEQRLYQAILRALRQSSGQRLDVRFRAAATPCPLHGDHGAGPDPAAVVPKEDI